MADNIVIGASLPKTGNYAETQFLQYQRAYDQWVADQNAAGGILGKQIEFKWYDDFGKGETAGENYAKLIDEDKVDLLLGPCHSVIIEPMAHVTEERKMVLLEGSGSVSEMFRKGRKYLFLVWGADCDYMQSFMEMMSEDGNPKKVSKVGMIYGNRPRGLGHAQGVRDHAARLGLDVVYDGKIGEEPDYAAVGKAAAEAGAEILLWDMEARGPAKKAAIQAVCDAGFAPSQLWLSEQPNPAGSEVDGLFSRVTWAPNDPSPKSLKFYNDFKRLWNAEPEYHSAGGYACGEVLAQATEIAGTTDNEKIREAILNNEFDTVMGKLRFAENGLPIATFPVAQWQNGVPELVYPATAKTKDPIFVEAIKH
jgi:branched-chain amino acid transport system substrate-binding protein